MKKNLKPGIYQSKACAGFSLIELIVSISIFLLLSSVTLVNHSKFSGAVELENLAYDVALSIRQAQVFGLSVKEFEPRSGEFQQGYGVHFNKNTPTKFVIFTDRDLTSYGGPPINSQYDTTVPCGVVGTECIETFTIRKGNRISDFCARLSSSIQRCVSLGDLSYINIIFVRPDPDAVITSDVVSEIYTDAVVTVKSPKGIERDVVTQLTGQISIPSASRNP